MFLYSANIRINLTCPECFELDISTCATFTKFIFSHYDIAISVESSYCCSSSLG